MTTDLHPDHMTLLSLARMAFRARDDRHLWRGNVREAAEQHGAACDALWDELERQVAAMDGLVPTIDHPTLKYRKMVARWRSEMVDAVQAAGAATLDDLAHGPLLEDEE